MGIINCNDEPGRRLDNQREAKMKWAKFLLATIFFAAAVGIGTSAIAADGLNDSHGVWRDAQYWHANHPEWVYRYHPEWAVDHRDWWLADHQGHPEWFNSPYWRRYPVWTYGAYDRGHVWRDAGWWHERDAGWFYAHHPEWAEAHPGWIREDHGRHPEWFHSAYWSEHPRDWNHPGEEYRRELSRNIEYQRSHPASAELANRHENDHAGAGVTEHQNTMAGGSHEAAANQFHAPAPFHPSEPAKSVSHGGGGGGDKGKH
ncbi:hypothetical protein [Candidatus Binatus sp.]|uniref:hypothetical protein n=2 Tax=Candidatus Binatus sp. TaxID=2811406 RepID=UPI003BEA629A